MPDYISPGIFPYQLIDPSTGLLMDGGSIESRIKGTATGQNMFSDSDGTSVGTSLTLNSSGIPEHSGAEVQIYVEVGVDYEFKIKNAAGDTLRTVDYVGYKASNLYNDTNVSGDNIKTAINNLAIMYKDFTPDTGGTRTLTASDFGRGTKFTHASAITLSIPDDTIVEGKGPAVIWYPNDQLSTLTIDAPGSATVEADTEYNPGALIAIYRMSENVFKVGGC